MRRPSRRLLGRIADVTIPWGVGLFLVLVVLEEGKHNDSSALILLGIALAVAQGAALWWRRSHPELVMAVTLAGGLGILLLAPEVVLPVAGLFAIGSLAAAPAASVARRPRGAHRPGGVQLLHTTVEDTVFTMGLAVGAWALGEAARNRRAAIEEEARRAVGDERAHIARELHDVDRSQRLRDRGSGRGSRRRLRRTARSGPRCAALDRALWARGHGRAPPPAGRGAP